jgi:hypothetical protein
MSEILDKAKLLTAWHLEGERERERQRERRRDRERDKERHEGLNIPFKDTPTMSYFLQLGLTS